MIMQIEGVVAPEAVAALTVALSEEGATFVPGVATAGWHARTVKNNQQASGNAARSATAAVEKALLANPLFKAAARPKQLVGLLVSRYGPGMEYGLHVDDALMHGVRTDLSFTVFLSGPDTYEGGELVIEGNDADSAIKLAAGSVVIYPTTSLHRVAPVTAGERLVVVGWVRSLIRRADQREVLFDLDAVVADMRKAGQMTPDLARILKVRANLQRMWVED
jgi:PKHD-type hydroxylase